MRHTEKATTSASTFVGYCIGNIIGPLIFGASPGPLYRAGFIGSFVCLCLVMGVATSIYFLLKMENARRNRISDGQSIYHSLDEDLTDVENKQFQYVL